MKKILGFIMALLAVIGIGAGTVYANPSMFANHTATATATTTTSFVKYGVSTSTMAITWNSNGNNQKIDQALVIFQAEASTTQSHAVRVFVQYSLDNVDWYAQTEATSTFSQAVEKSLLFTISTSTDQIASSTGTIYRVNKSFTIDTPTPYVRIRFSSETAASPVAIWADYQPVKEQYN